jgi:hypothetical protein
MKKLFVAAALIATSFAALADGEAFANPMVTGSPITRAQAASDLQRAAASGALVSGEGPSITGTYVTPAHAARMLSRAEVRAELDMARRNGELTEGEFRFAPGTRTQTGMQLAQH